MSERKFKEQALRESEQQLRFLSSQLLIVQENERGRISKELHDEVGQALMILKFQISSIEARLSENQKVLRNECEGLLTYLDNTIENVRRLSWDLSPSALEQFGARHRHQESPGKFQQTLSYSVGTEPGRPHR